MNKLRREAAEDTAQYLLDMQSKVNNKLMEMDTTFMLVHEGKTLNDTSIQLLMKKMNILGEQL